MMKAKLTFVLLLLCVHFSHAQYNTKRRPAKSSGTHSSQWWIGIKGGTNFTNPKASGQFETFSFTAEPSPDNAEKSYDQFRLPGYQFGFIVGFEFLSGLSAQIQPVFTGYGYSYSINYYWASLEDQSKNVTVTYDHENHLQYLELPLSIKYELQKGKIKPYIHGGAYISRLINATKKVTETITDNATGGNSIYDENNYAGQIEDFYLKSNWGFLAGAGVTQNVGNARFGLEVNYKIGMKNITNSASRYQDNQFVSGVFDVQDDIQLNHLEISVSVVMPLKFITSQDYVPL